MSALPIPGSPWEGPAYGFLLVSFDGWECVTAQWFSTLAEAREAADQCALNDEVKALGTVWWHITDLDTGDIAVSGEVT